MKSIVLAGMLALTAGAASAGTLHIHNAGWYVAKVTANDEGSNRVREYWVHLGETIHLEGDLRPVTIKAYTGLLDQGNYSYIWSGTTGLPGKTSHITTHGTTFNQWYDYSTDTEVYVSDKPIKLTIS